MLMATEGPMKLLRGVLLMAAAISLSSCAGPSPTSPTLVDRGPLVPPAPPRTPPLLPFRTGYRYYAEKVYWRQSAAYNVILERTR